MAKTSRSLLFGVLVLFLAAFVVIGFTPEPSFAADETTPTGVTSVSISLGDTIAVKLHTSAVSDDGSKVVVAYNGKDNVLAKNAGGVFTFTGVTPQNFADELTATMYAKDGTQVGESVTFSVRSYLEAILTLSYEDSGCSSQLQYTAMKELAVNMLNYGAAAQVYVDHDTTNLANKNLTDEQKALATKPITVTAGDKAVNGDAWVGAGVRFDYRLGLYFVFEAESLEGVTATINGRNVTPAIYDASKNWYVIRFSDFGATNMNDVVTAKLTIGGSEQTYAYSIKSYVAAKGGDDSALAKLVNATYAYGYAAVAFDGKLAVVEPTFESVGKVGIDPKGYDFTDSVYAPVELPKLNEKDYTITTSFSGASAKPTVYIVYTFNNGNVSYSTKVQQKDALRVNDKVYTSNDIALLNSDEVEVTYDEATGYTYHAKTAQSLTFIAAYGNSLTITGDVTVVRDADNWNHYNTLNIGTAAVAGNLTVDTTNSNNWGIRLEGGADMYIAEGSTMTVNAGACNYSVFSAAQGTTITVDGTLTTGGKIRLEKVAKIDASYEYGFQPNLYIRKGTVTIENGQLMTNALQVGSEKYGYSGTLNITQTVKGTNAATGGSTLENTITFENRDGALRYAFGKGTVNLTDATTAGLTAIDARNEKSSYLIFGSGITVNANDKYVYLVGSWSVSTSYSWSISTDAKFNVSMGTLMTQAYNAGSTNISYTTPVTLTVDGETVTALIAEYSIAAGTATVSASNLVDNGDGTKSFADLTFTAGNYASGTETVSFGEWGTFTKATYTDGEGTVHTIYYKAISAHTHHTTLVEGKEPTCTETGVADSYSCECGRLFSDAAAENEITAPAVLPMKEHTEAVDAAVPPTCTDTGLTEGKHCSVCGTVIVAQETEAALGHLDENNDYICDRTDCGIKLCTSHVEVVDEGKVATCTEDGLTEGKHCSVCGEILEAQTVITSLGHTEEVDEAVAATCTATGLTEGKHCSVCSETLVEQKVTEAINHANAEYISQVDATFDSTGMTAYYSCPDCDKKFADEECTTETTPVVTPKLSLTDYTTETTKGGTDKAPVMTTVFTLKSETLVYSVSLESNDCIRINRGNGDVYVSKYDYQKLNTDIATITYVEGKGYFYDVKDGETDTVFAGYGLRTYGTTLTITGNITISLAVRWGHNVGLILGTAEKPATVILNSTVAADNTTDACSFALFDGADMTINKGSSLTITGAHARALWATNSGSQIVVDGTLTTKGGITVAGGASANANYEYGFVPYLYVRSGTVNVTGQIIVSSLQVGSEKDNCFGTINATHSDNNIYRTGGSAVVRYALANGSINFKNTSSSGKCAIDIRTSGGAYVDIRSGMKITLDGKFGSTIGEWTTGTYHIAIQEGTTVDLGGNVHFIRVGNKTVNVYCWTTATVNIGGEDKQVKVVNASTYTAAGYHELTANKFYTAVENAQYTATENTITCGQLGTFKEATYTDGEGTVHTIYYQVNE